MRAFVTAVCLLAMSFSGRARADDYQATIDEGVREFGAGNFVEARALFEHAHALNPNARTLRALGICAYELKHYEQATQELSAALSDSRNPLSPDLAAAVNETLERARRFVGELVLETQPVDSRVVIDGEARSGRRYALDVGDHLVVASADGYRSSDLTVTIAGMQRREVVLVLTPLASAQAAVPPLAPGPSSTADTPGLAERWWFWTAIGVIVVGATAAALVVATSDSSSSNAGTTGITLHTK